jgi:hypothetical protein
MPSKAGLYGIVALLTALLVVSATAAAVFYGQYKQADSDKTRYVGELDAALASYRALSDSFNASLQDYNRTLSLLADAVANLNTSTPAYRNASTALASLWSSYESLAGSRSGVVVYEVNVLVDYGNGTRHWYNDTKIQPGWNGYVATLVAMDGNVQAAWYPQYGEHFVTGVGGVPDTQSRFWFLLTYDVTTSWQVAQSGVDQIPVFNGTVFAWAFCPENASYGPTCPLP